VLASIGSQDIFFLIYNSFNDLLTKMRLSSSLYVNELIDSSSQKNEGTMITLILSTLIVAGMLAALVPVMRSVNSNKSKVLSLFCEIEDAAVQKLSYKCDRFLMKLQAEGTEDDGDSDNEEVGMLIGESTTAIQTIDEDDYG